MVRKLVFLVLVLIMASSAYAQINDWTGATSRDWMDPTNWSLGVVPSTTNTVNVRIDRGPANMPLISTGENASSGSGDTWAPEWGASIDIQGGTYTGYGFVGMAAISNPAFDPVSVVNLGANGTGGSITVGEWCLGSSWWYGMGNVDLNVYSGQGTSTGWTWLGGHMNLHGGEITATGGINIAAQGQDNTVCAINIFAPDANNAGGILSIPASYWDSGQVGTWISQGYITSPNGTLLADEATNPGRVLITATVPEPSTIAMLCLALLGGLAFIRRKRG